MVKLLLIAGFGGFSGTVRFLISRFIQISSVSVFPRRIFIVNLFGSLLTGIFFGILVKGDLMSPPYLRPCGTRIPCRPGRCECILI